MPDIKGPRSICLRETKDWRPATVLAGLVGSWKAAASKTMTSSKTFIPSVRPRSSSCVVGSAWVEREASTKGTRAAG